MGPESASPLIAYLCPSETLWRAEQGAGGIPPVGDGLDTGAARLTAMSASVGSSVTAAGVLRASVTARVSPGPPIVAPPVAVPVSWAAVSPTVPVAVSVTAYLTVPVFVAVSVTAAVSSVSLAASVTSAGAVSVVVPPASPPSASDS